MSEKLYAVGCLYFIENSLVIEFHKGTCPIDAFLKHSMKLFNEGDLLQALDTEKTIAEITLDELQDLIFDYDGAVDIQEVPNDDAN